MNWLKIKSAVENKLINLLSNLRGFNIVTSLVLEFKKVGNNDEAKFTTFYSNSKAEITIIDVIFESICTKVISNIQKYLGKGSGWIIDSTVNHTINISK